MGASAGANVKNCCAHCNCGDEKAQIEFKPESEGHQATESSGTSAEAKNQAIIGMHIKATSLSRSSAKQSVAHDPRLQALEDILPTAPRIVLKVWPNLQS